MVFIRILCKPGLGQGFRVYKKLIKQIILKLQQVIFSYELALKGGLGTMAWLDQPSSKQSLCYLIP